MAIFLAVAAVGTALVHSYQYSNDTKDTHEHTYLSRFEVVHLLSWALWGQRMDSVYTRRFWFYSTAVYVDSPWMRAHEATSGRASWQINLFVLYTDEQQTRWREGPVCVLNSNNAQGQQTPAGNQRGERILYRHLVRFVVRSYVWLNPEYGRSAIGAERPILIPSTTVRMI